MLSLLVEALCKTTRFIVGNSGFSVEWAGVTNSTTPLYTQPFQSLHTGLYTAKLLALPSVKEGFYTHSPALIIKTKFI